MDQQRDEIAKLMEEFGTAELTPRQTGMLDQVTILQQELIYADIKRISLETRLKALESENPEDSALSPELQEYRNTITNNDPALQDLQSEMRWYESMVIEAEQTKAEANPELQRRRAMLKNLSDRVDTRRKEVSDQFDKMFANQADSNRKKQLVEIQSELTQTITYEKGIQDKMNSLDITTINFGRKQFAINDKQEQLNRTKEMYNEVSRRIEEIRVESQRPARISIAFRASSVPIEGRKFQIIGVGETVLLLILILILISPKSEKSTAIPPPSQP